jgi:hypothetical protein
VYESSVEVGKAKECLNILDISGRLSVDNSVDFLWVHLYPFSGDEQSQVFYFLHMKLAFVDIKV